MRVELRVDVIPPWPFRLGGAGRDGLLRRRGPGLQRLLHREDRPVLCGAVQVDASTVRFGARAATEDDARWGIERLRFALGVDDDLREFHHRFRRDPVIGPAVRAFVTWRPRRRPDPWEALAWAVTEQLIDGDSAEAIQRRMIARLGPPRCPETGLRAMPSPARVAAAAPAELSACDLHPKRAIALRRAATEVASGRVDLHAPDHERGWRRLLAISHIGPWTIECLAFHGQGRHDQIAALDLGYIKLVGRLLTGRPKARATEEQVRDFFAPYGEWKGLAGAIAIEGAKRGLVPDRAPARRPAASRPPAAQAAQPAHP